MERRDFFRLVAGTILILPVGNFLVACGEEDYGSGADGPAAAPRSTTGGIIYSTNMVDAHYHELTVPTTLLASPPSEGMSADTTVSGTHAHSVSISMADLANVQAGQTVKVSTGLAEGHSHVFTLTKLGTTTGPGPGYPPRDY